MSCADETQSLCESKAAMETETQHGEGEQSLPRQCRHRSMKETEEEEEDTTTRVS